MQEVLDFLFVGIQLKRTPRTGWAQRGVADAENVAAHSYGVVLAAMTLARIIDQEFDMARLLAMATLHDLPEALTSDIPSPVKRFFPLEGRDSIKTEIERAAMTEITENQSFGAEFRDLWEEMTARQTPESNLVHDADKLDMYIQAYVYEQQTGNKLLNQFWRKRHQFHFPATQSIYDLIAKRRER